MAIDLMFTKMFMSNEFQERSNRVTSTVLSDFVLGCWAPPLTSMGADK
jgi:hypothetical protein